jgi:hypothetical protein
VLRVGRDLGQLDEDLPLVLMKGSERGVIGGEVFRKLRYFFVVLQVISHKLEQGLLLGVELNLTLQVVTLFLKLFASVFVDLYLVLE